MVNTSEYEKTIEHQFDSFCKTVLRNHARTIYAENKQRNERFIEYSGTDYPSCPVVGNRCSGLDGTTIPVSETA